MMAKPVIAAGRIPPKAIVEAARAAMGEIHLDPAGSEWANETIRAHVWHQWQDATKVNMTWHGKVWLCPPFPPNDTNPLADRLLRELDADRVTHAVWLSPDCHDRDWGQALHERAAALCNIRGRLEFTYPGNWTSFTPWPATALFFCPNRYDRWQSDRVTAIHAFECAFEKIGQIWRRH